MEVDKEWDVELHVSNPNHHSNSLTLSKTTKLTVEFDVELHASNLNHHLPISYHDDAFNAKVFYKDQLGTFF